MTTPGLSRPLGLRLFNRTAGALRRAGLPIVELEPEALFDRARRLTGLGDFGDPFFREPLRVLLDALATEAELTALGRVIARTDLVRLLQNRLYMTDVANHHPEIWAGEIAQPIVIVGLPRTGTTILHQLLAQDRSNRVLMTWEVMHPWPPPERETYETDPRIPIVASHLAGVDRLLPGFQRMHPMGATLPQECVALTAHDFASMLFSTTHFVPSYQAWLDAADLRWVYASHRRQLQYLQWRCPADRWVLKSPGHLWALDALLAIYPDARIVQTHRDPLTVVASLANLVAMLRSMASDRIDRAAIGAEWTARLADGLARAMAVRAALPTGTAPIFDLHYRELIADEIGTVRRLYEHFGLELERDAEHRMHRFLADHPRDKHGVHEYTLAAAGLDAARERERYRAYTERFGIEPDEAVGCLK